MKKHISKITSTLLTLLIIFAMAIPASACTGVIVGKDLTTDGSAIFGRTEDLEVNHNKVYKINEAGKYKSGTTFVDADNGYEYQFTKDSYRYTSVSDTTPEYGEFDEAGFNEKGLVVDMTVSATCRDEIKAVDDYTEPGLAESSMPTIILSEADSAVNAIKLLAELIETKGAAEGNGLVVADKKEIWYMEIYSGHQFVAMKYPDDKFSVFPNTFWLNEVTLDEGEEKNNYMVSKDEKFIYSKGIFKVAKDAKTFVGDESTRKIDLYKSYANPTLSDGNRSRAFSGIKHLNPNSTVKITDELYEFLQDAPKKSISLEQVMSFTRNRLENISVEANDIGGKSSQYPIGNRNTMEAHIFQMIPGLDALTPAIMWQALGTPLASPYVPYYANQTDVIAAAANETNEFNENSVYWLAMDILHMVEYNREALMPLVNEKRDAIEKELIEAAIKTTPSAKDATANNNELATKAYKMLKALRNELLPHYKELLDTNEYVVPYRITRKTPEFDGSLLSVDAGTSDKKLQLAIVKNSKKPGSGSIFVTDYYGDKAELKKPVEIIIPKSAFTGEIFFTANGEEVKYVEEANSIKIVTLANSIAFNLKAEHKFIKNENGSVNVDTKDGYEVGIDADIDNFINVKLDGKLVAPENYTKKAGSLYVTFKPEFINTLAVKTHKLEFLFKDGLAATNVTIKAKTTIEKPNTDTKTLPNAGIDTISLYNLVGGTLIVGAAYLMRKNKKEN
ncbi:MAG: C69 family dipeptidase [Erysipelotrichaceae bacterium]|nr:C69 family dipeptidase [Erysipelotrichaceae bacterium]